MNSTNVLFTQEVQLRPLVRDEAILLGLLRKMPHQPVMRTVMVKLVYMLDVYACEQTGSQLTSFTYTWDNYGPNASGNAIVKMLDHLANEGFIRHERVANQYGSLSHIYGLEGRQISLDLTPDDWVFIEGIVREYGRLNWKRVVAASKESAPMQGVKQGDTLTLAPDPEVERIREELSEKHGTRIEQSLAVARKDFESGSGLTWERMEKELARTRSGR